MLPRSVKIGAHNYKIQMAPKKELKGVYAKVESTTNTIKLHKDATQSRKVELVLHESLHAMLDGHDLEDEETIVVILGEAITRFIADNPFFMVEAMRILSAEKKFAAAVDKAAGKS